jgi:hypothetical protein
MVLRTDDFGNTFLVAEDIDETPAKELMEEMARKGHHQTYDYYGYGPGERRQLLEKHKVLE